MTETSKLAVVKYVDTETVQEDIAFSPEDLHSAMIQQASTYSFYANSHARAQKQLNHYKMLADLTVAKLDNTIRQEAIEAGEKITEGKVTQAIHRHPKYIKIQTLLNDAREVADVAKEVLEALRHRRDMLIQVGAAMREEMKGALRMGESADLRKRALDIAGGKQSAGQA